MNNKNSDDKYKEEKSEHQHANEIFINKTIEDTALIKRLISMNLQ